VIRDPFHRYIGFFDSSIQRLNDSTPAKRLRHTNVTVKVLTGRIGVRQLRSMMKLRIGKLLGLSIALGLGANASAQMMINGAGATFPYPIYSKWFDEYTKVDPSVRFNYQSIGSGGGQKQIMAQTVDFGASDGPMSDDNLSKAPGKLLHIPTVAGAVVITYNVEGSPALKFDGETIAGIFLGQIKKWNDPKIAATNPGVKLPDKDIVVVHRSDGSGTTFIFTDYLSKISPEWKSKVGTNTSVSWPTGIGGKGNEGVSGQVKQTPGALGYVELIYAIQNKMAYAEIKNAAGEFIKPTIDSVTAALAIANIPDDFRFSMTNAPGKDAYPIAGATWLLVYQQQKDAAKGKKLVEFLKWALTKGEAIAKDLDYAPLPESVQQRVLKRVDEIKM
jgi:phosphate transport system substrate-binding protein